MSTENELRKWLRRSETTFADNLNFGIKVCNSIDFILITKYEIVIEYLIENLDELNDKSNVKIINQMLGLNYTANNLSSGIKLRLVESLTSVSVRLKARKGVIDCLLTVLHHGSMWNFYKNNFEVFLRFFGAVLNFYTRYADGVTKKVQDDLDRIRNMLESFKEYAKLMSKIGEFENKIVQHVYGPLTDFYFKMKTKNADFRQEYIEIFQISLSGITNLDSFDIFLEKNTDSFEKYLIFVTFDNILSCSVLSTELKSELGTRLVNYGYSNVSLFSNTLDNLLFYNYTINLLIKHKINVEIKEDNHINQLIESNHVEYPYETLSILCSLLKFNPTIIMKNIYDLIIIFMFKKKSERVKQKYDEFLNLVIEMFIKLYQTKVFVIKLIESINTYLKNNKISKKLKRKLNDESICESYQVDSNDRFSQIIKQFDHHNQVQQNEMHLNWPDIDYAWPTKMIGSKIISSIQVLVTGLSLSVWQTILFEFNKAVDDIDAMEQSDENILFYIDFLTSFICYYYMGNRVIEYYHKFQVKIDKTQNDVKAFLKKFSTKLFYLEHTPRLMNNFLQLAYYVGNFDLLLWYYYPDTLSAADTPQIFHQKCKQLHDYLTADEWMLIEQRIINFGKTECERNLNLLKLQKLKSESLFSQSKKKINIDTLLKSTVVNYNQLKIILNDNHTNLWFIENINKDDKAKIISTLLLEYYETANTSIISANLHENQDFIYLLIIEIYKNILTETYSSKKDILAKKIDFDRILGESNYYEVIKYLQSIIKSYETSCEEIKVKKVNKELLAKNYALLNVLPIHNMPREIKTAVFCFNLCVYVDLKYSDEEDVIGMCMNGFKATVEFGEIASAIKQFGIELLTKIFDNLQNLRIIFYPLIKSEKDTKIEISNNLLNLFESNKSNYLLQLLLIDAEILVTKRFPFLIKNKDNVEKLAKLKIKLSNVIINYLIDKFINPTDMNTSVGGKLIADDKNFLKITLKGFSYVVKIYVENDTFTNTGETEIAYNKNVINLIKLYIKNSIELNNEYVINLLNSIIAIKKKTTAIIKLSDYDKIIKKFWNLFVANRFADCNGDSETSNGDNLIDFEKYYRSDLDNICTNNILLFNNVFELKSDQEFVLMLSEIYQLGVNGDEFTGAVNLMSQLAGCTFSDNKKIIFMEFFHRTVNEMLLKLSDADLLKYDLKFVLNLLIAYNTLLINPNLNKNVLQIDDILSFLFELKITTYNEHLISLEDNRDKHIQFMLILWNIIEILINLIKSSNKIIINRLPQFIGIVKNILQTICWYGLANDSTNPNKNNGETDGSNMDNRIYNLTSSDITLLSKLSHKLEKLIFLLIKNANDLRILVPYLICFIIHVMITKSNVTTLNNSIKTHFVNICYSLISVSSEKQKGFILRLSNDAGRKVYENLVRGYEKYKQFKGSS